MLGCVRLGCKAPFLGKLWAVSLFLCLFCCTFLATGVDAKRSSFALSIKPSSNFDGKSLTSKTIDIGCQSQVNQATRPLEGVLEAELLHVNGTCLEQPIYKSYFETPHLESIEGKVAIVQFSSCGTTWREFHTDYLYMSLQLSRAGAKGIVFAENARGKSPEVIYTDLSVQILLAPTCVITAESYDLITGLVEESQRQRGEGNTLGEESEEKENATTTRGTLFQMDTSRLLFPLDFLVDPSNHFLYKLIVMVQVQGIGDGLAPLDMPSPGLALVIGPQHHPEIIAEVVVGKLHPDCMVTGYEECRACWTKKASEIFTNSDDFAGKLVWIRELEFARYCLFSYQDYAIELDKTSAAAVAFGTRMLALHANTPGYIVDRPGYYSYENISIPSYIISQELEKSIDTFVNKGANSSLTVKLNSYTEAPPPDNSTELQATGPSQVTAGFWVTSTENRLKGPVSMEKYFTCTALPLLTVNKTIPAIEGPQGVSSSASNMGSNLIEGTRLIKIQPASQCSRDRINMDCKLCLSMPVSKQFYAIDGDLENPLFTGILDVEEFPCHTVIALMMFSINSGKRLKSLFVKLAKDIVEDGDQNSNGYGANVESMGNNLGNVPHLSSMLLQNKLAPPVFLLLPSCYKRFEEALFPALPLSNRLPQQVYIGLPKISTDTNGIMTSLGGPIVNSTLDMTEDQKVLVQVVQPHHLRALHIAGRSEMSTSIKPLARGLRLVLAPEECNRLDTCHLCTPAFQQEDYDLENQIAFFPLDQSYSAVVKDLVGNGICLLPRYRLAKMLEDRGASAVIFGNNEDEVQLDSQKGWHESVKIPILNVPRHVSDLWFKALNQSDESNSRMIVYVSEDIGSPLIGETDVALAPFVRAKLVNGRSDFNVSGAGDLLVAQGNINTSTKQDQDKLTVESKSKDKWAYEIALWGGIGSVCFAAGVVTLLIKHYKGRLSSHSHAGISIRTVNLPETSAEVRIRRNQNNYPDRIVMQQTYGWGPFRPANRSGLYR